MSAQEKHKSYMKSRIRTPEYRAKRQLQKRIKRQTIKGKIYSKIRAAKPERIIYNKAHGKMRTQNKKKLVFDHYGWKCICCGESMPDTLSIDHIKGGGSKHEKEVGQLYSWLIKNNFPDGFQTLCMNCNFMKAKPWNHNQCPHKKRTYTGSGAIELR